MVNLRAVPINERFMPVAPAAVWEVLADPASYGYWVVGSKVIRDADPGWPEPGSRFHHTIGAGPFTLSDHTEALEASPPEWLKLRTKARPLGTATVTLEMLPRAGGTVVRMSEHAPGLARVLSYNPLVHQLTRLRNAEALMRLEELAARRAR